MKVEKLATKETWQLKNSERTHVKDLRKQNRFAVTTKSAVIPKLAEYENLSTVGLLLLDYFFSCIRKGKKSPGDLEKIQHLAAELNVK